jgi:hypothetical protein
LTKISFTESELQWGHRVLWVGFFFAMGRPCCNSQGNRLGLRYSVKSHVPLENRRRA